MSAVLRVDVTLRPHGLEAFPGATARIHWTDIAVVAREEALTVPAPAPGMTFLTAGPEEITLPQHHGTWQENHGARMMRAAAVGEEEEEEGGEEVEAGLRNLQATPNTNPDRNQGHGRMNATL